MNDPIKDIEDKKGNEDMGKLAVQVFRGAREEADTFLDAFWAVAAYYCGMFRSAQNPDPDEEQ